MRHPHVRHLDEGRIRGSQVFSLCIADAAALLPLGDVTISYAVYGLDAVRILAEFLPQLKDCLVEHSRVAAEIESPQIAQQRITQQHLAWLGRKFADKAQLPQRQRSRAPFRANEHKPFYVNAV